jgi:hypothetical protein
LKTPDRIGELAGYNFSYLQNQFSNKYFLPFKAS